MLAGNVQSDNLAQFKNIYKMILERKGPLEESYVRYNLTRLINKNLQKAIMNRSKFLNR